MKEEKRKTAKKRTQRPEARTTLLQLSVLALAGGMIALGIKAGEAETVFQKAAMICLECIGIG